MTNEYMHSINGVEGRMFARHTWGTVTDLFSNQTWKSSREYRQHGRAMRLVIELRFDDECRNGHHSFSMTGTISEARGSHFYSVGCGCVHEEIERIFPELAHLIKWHLTSSDGPLHYIANTLYFAGDRDHNGLRKGEVRQLRNGKTGQLAWKRTDSTLPRYVDSDTRPIDAQCVYYEPWVQVGTGKERELDHARASAVWPEATDAELMSDDLKQRLEARHPALMRDFRRAMESCGFAWMPRVETPGASVSA